MILKWLVLTYFCAILVHCEENLEILLKTRSSYLETYTQYSDVTVMRFIIPEDTSFTSFKFMADETDMSIFGCSPRDVTVYMKYGAPPVINPDGTKFPENFKNISRLDLYDFELKSDKTVHYINITSPIPGSYYVGAFLSYMDPRKKAIKQQGLSSKCFASVDNIVYIKKSEVTKIAVEEKDFIVYAHVRESIFYKIYIPDSVDYVVVTIDNIVFSENVTKLIVRSQNQRIPSLYDYINTKSISPAEKQPVFFKFTTEEDKWHYIEFYFTSDDNKLITPRTSSLKFNFKFFSSELEKNSSKSDNKTSLFKEPIFKLYQPSNITRIMPYKQFNLLREGNTDSGFFSYELESEMELSMPIPINMTSSEFVTLKFTINDLSDVGGTLQYILAFKPRIKKDGRKRTIEPEPEEHAIIACISRGYQEIPQWPDQCSYNGTERKSPLMISKKDKNSTMLIPYPESGTWYATFKLFCGSCEPCNCSKECQDKFTVCLEHCDSTCNSESKCNSCVRDCKKQIVTTDACKGCDCDGKCKRTSPKCNSSALFDISSQSCVLGECGKNGKCMLMVSDGVIYSTCLCSNRYRGWDCSDDSLANPYWLVVLELLLLVLSNLAFLPSVYVAYRKKYFTEAICYFAICFFSTFYHSCDAGEHLINFCITRLSSLQFADFFCALLAIWVTLIAIADLPSYFPSLFHIGGAIVLAFCTTINKTALWIFTVPAASGIAIIGISWYMKYKKVKQMFLRKRYLCLNIPVGSVLVTVGLIIYAALQTENNYKYLHSMWHILMAVAVLILLPSKETFHPALDL